MKPSKAKKAKAEANGSAKKELKVAARKKRESAALKGEPSPELGDVENGAEAEDELDVPDEVDGKRYFAHEEEYDGVLDWEVRDLSHPRCPVWGSKLTLAGQTAARQGDRDHRASRGWRAQALCCLVRCSDAIFGFIEADLAWYCRSEDNTYSWVASKLARKRCPQKVSRVCPASCRVPTNVSSGRRSSTSTR